MKILVTGGAGFIGSHTVKTLLNRGFEVAVVDNFNDYYDVSTKEGNIRPFLNHPKFKLYRGDIAQAELKRIFQEQQIDKICHLAARAGVRASIQNPFLYEETNIKGMLNLLECAKEFKIKNFVFASSSSVYGNQTKIPFSETDNVDYPISPYAATKKAAELMAYTYHYLYGLKCTGLRFFTVYGPSGRPDMAPYLFTEAINTGKEIKRFGDGTTRRDYTYVDDIIEGITAALDKDFDFEIFNLGNNTPVELNELISTIENILNKKAVIKQYPLQEGDVEVTYADISKAKKMLGYNPATKIKPGMEKFIEWYLKKQSNAL